MLRFVFGFIFGLVSAAYTLPFIESHFGKIPLPGLSKNVSNEAHSSNVINPLPPARTNNSVQSNNISVKIQTALSVIRTRSLDDTTSDFVLALVTDLVEAEPKIHTFVRDRIGGGLTNKEALEIFEMFYTLQG